MLVSARMTRNPVTATPDMSVAEASELMKREKVHRLPVLDKEKKLVGVVSEKNVLYASPSPVSTLSIHEMVFLLSQLKVADIMTKNPVTINSDITVEEAARLMVDHDLSCLPVVDEGKLVGIVSKSDLFKTLLELFGARHFGVRLIFLVDDRPGVLANIARVLSERGIDIISVGTFMGTDPSTASCLLKLQGVSAKDAVEIIKPYVIEISDVREI